MADTRASSGAGGEGGGGGGKMELPKCIDHHHQFNLAQCVIFGADLSVKEDCEAAMAYIREWAILHPQIGVCRLNFCKLSAVGARLLARNVLPVMPNITKFDVCANPIGDEGVEELAVAIKEHCPQVTVANFGWTKMGNVGFRSLCRHLPAATDDFSIDGNQIRSIPAELRRLEHLQKLICSENPWSDEWKPEEDASPQADAISALEYARSLPAPDDDDDEIMVKPAV